MRSYFVCAVCLCAVVVFMWRYDMNDHLQVKLSDLGLTEALVEHYVKSYCNASVDYSSLPPSTPLKYGFDTTTMSRSLYPVN